MSDSSVPEPASLADDRRGSGPENASKTATLKAHRIPAMVIAASALIAGMVVVIPLGIVLGNGAGTPGTLFLVVVILGLLAIGDVRVVPNIRSTGAFYAYVTKGLGRPADLASAYVTGIHSTVINSLLWLYIPVAVTGVVVALRLKSWDPRRYADLGSSRVD